MDIVQAKTFLAIVEGGNFLAAAKRVNVTQSTVSARIKSLEAQLGKLLFIRTKAGCELTPAGHQFYRYATSMVRIWEEAKHQVAVPDGFGDTLIIGGQYSLWNRFLMRWVPHFQKIAPQIAVRCEVGMSRRLIREMSEGVMDIAVLYKPEQRSGLHVEELLEDQLILVSTDSAKPIEENYVFVDWGAEFRQDHAQAFPHLHNPGLTLDLGALGVQMLINQGGAGYFPKRVVEAHIEAGYLSKVRGAPEFRYPAFLVYQNEFASRTIMDQALSSLKNIATQSINGELPPPFFGRK